MFAHELTCQAGKILHTDVYDWEQLASSMCFAPYMWKTTEHRPKISLSRIIHMFLIPFQNRTWVQGLTRIRLPEDVAIPAMIFTPNRTH